MNRSIIVLAAFRNMQFKFVEVCSVADRIICKSRTELFDRSAAFKCLFYHDMKVPQTRNQIEELSRETGADEKSIISGTMERFD